MAIIATYLGIVEEDKINDMSYLFFEDIMEHLGKRLRYDAIVNYAGNSFCEKSWEMIEESFPIGNHSKNSSSNANAAIANFFEHATVSMGG